MPLQVANLQLSPLVHLRVEEQDDGLIILTRVERVDDQLGKFKFTDRINIPKQQRLNLAKFLEQDQP